MSKTEQKILSELANTQRVHVFGKREVYAARKLQERGLANFVNTSHIVPAVQSNIRRRNGDYVSYFVFQGHVESK